MRRFATALLLAFGLSGHAALAGPPPSPPAPPATGFGSEATAFPATTTHTIANPQYPAAPVTVIGPAGGALPERLPVVLFAHGFGAVNTKGYVQWLEHIARQGAWVVFPIYPAIPSGSQCGRYDIVWAGMEAAVKALAAEKGPAPDLSRVGFMGHSFGGGVAPAMAGRAAARGWGSKAMWIECYAPWYDLDLTAWPHLPANACLLSVGYEDDRVCDPATASGFLAKASAVPGDRKTFLLFHSDAHGTPALVADHMAPLASSPDALASRLYPPDALDTRGTWRLDDALRSFAITAAPEARARVLGTGPETTGLGEWSDGVPVAPLSLATADGAPGGHPRGRYWAADGPAEKMMRSLLPLECCCGLPLPPPAEAPASRLPASERIVRAAPKDGWPAEIAAAAAKSPVCVVLYREKSAASGGVLAAIDGAAEAMKARGIVTLRMDIAANAALAKALHVNADPSVLNADPSVLLIAKGGELLLWREGVEPNLVPAILDLVKPQ